MPENIKQLEEQIRDCINAPPRQETLMEDADSWHMLCSCLDAIGDTEIALDAYTRQPFLDGGELYLAVYGVLQVLIVQQDAVRYLAEALDIQIERDEITDNIRKVRNASIGHPTKYSSMNEFTFNFLPRQLLGQKDFTLLMLSEDTTESKDINIMELIVSQREVLSNVLSKVVSELEKTDDA